MIGIDLSKQQTLDADPKAIQQINFTGNLAREGNANTAMFSIIEEANETIFYFAQGIVKVLWMLSYDLATECSTTHFPFNISIKWLNITL